MTSLKSTYGRQGWGATEREYWVTREASRGRPLLRRFSDEGLCPGINESIVRVMARMLKETLAQIFKLGHP